MGEYLFIVSAVLSIANGFVLLYVNPRRAVNQVFCGASVWIALWALCIAMAIREGELSDELPSQQLVLWLKLTSIVGAYLGWLLWLMQDVVTAESQSLSNTLKRSWPWFGLATLAASLTLSDEFVRPYITAVDDRRGVAYVAYVAIVSIGTLTIASIALGRMRHLKGIQRVEMQYLVMGFAVALFGALSCSALGRILDVQWLRRAGPMWLLALHAIAFWGVCYQRVFDAKDIVFSIIQRLLTILVISVLAFGAWRIGQISSQSLWLAFLTVFAAASVVILADKPVRNWLHLEPESKVAGTRRRIVEWARAEPDEHKLKRSFVDLLADLCSTKVVYFLPEQGAQYSDETHVVSQKWPGLLPLDANGWATPESLTRSRLGTGSSECMHYLQENRLGLLLAVPRGSAIPSLIVGLGNRDSTRPYTFPEIQVLLSLVETMDNILAHTRVAAHAARIEKMEAAAMMSRGLAHDLNNLVTPVSTVLMHMESKVRAGSDEAAVLAHAQQSVATIQEYVRESLFFARRMEPQWQMFDAATLLPEVQEIVRDRAPQKHIAIELRSEGQTSMCADRPLLRRLLQNLVCNAIDALPVEGGTIAISAFATADNQVALRVADNGPGVPGQLVERIFEPYFTTKDFGRGGRRGLGLGLAICRKIVDLHAGTLTLTANQPHGAVFTAVLARAPDPLPVINPSNPENPGAPSVTTVLKPDAPA